MIAGLGWTAPWLLVALIALPILWLILRAIPPAPIRRRFPGVALLLGLTDDEQVTDRTPWWLLLLRMLAIAGLIIGLAGPILDPQGESDDGDGPLLIALDASWAGASDWPRLLDAVSTELNSAGSDSRPVALLSLTDPDAPTFLAANQWQARLTGLLPKPWHPVDVETVRPLLNDAGDFDTIWFSDGIDYAARGTLLDLFEARGDVRVVQSPGATFGLRPAKYVDGLVQVEAVRSDPSDPREISILAEGRDPSGAAATLARATADFETGGTEAFVELSLPAELRARITHFQIENTRSAGAVALSDDSLQSREVALIAAGAGAEGLELLSPLHFLENALVTSVDLLDGQLSDVLPANPDVIVLADVAKLAEAEAVKILEWVENGGLLLRFAGPRVAASDVSRSEEDPLMPVRLRAGGRSVGGAMSWGTPKALAEFPEDSPFYGLNVPSDVEITAQVVAQPDPTLADRVIAALDDGTPLVTRKSVGQGQVILFHVTANAEWSNLTISGLFPQMLERLAITANSGTPEAEDLEGTIWTPVRVMDGFGRLDEADTRAGIPGAKLAELQTGPDMLPGVYESGGRSIARNVLQADSVLTPATWPDRIAVSGFSEATERPLGGLLLSLAIGLMVMDVIASLALSGRLVGPAATAALALVLLAPGAADAQDAEVNGAAEVVLAYVETGNASVDEVSFAGLTGLSDMLFFRTSVEPATPVGIDLETDELAFYPMLYWPVTPDQPRPSQEAYARLNDYLRSGGLVLFDTRDGDISGIGSGGANARKLRDLAAALDVPALEPVPHDHVLTRTFYLIQDFPGRHRSPDLWVEASPPDAELVEGMPFRNLNDGVTPVVIGANDWAAAWAVNAQGLPMVQIGRGVNGERQREMAYRFGINLVMHVLTGNYKSDQVHVDDLLERLNQ